MSLYLSTTPCTAQRTALTVTYPRKETEKKDVAVCVKGMDFQVRRLGQRRQRGTGLERQLEGAGGVDGGYFNVWGG